jgi:multidrug efflux pump subunit AcrA (membrane-fusion protein)
MNKPTAPAIVDTTAGDVRPGERIAALLDDGGRSRGLRRALLIIVGVAIVFSVWIVLAQVDELARARGEVQPQGRLQAVQSEEGGTVVEFLVRKGDTVKAGQPIARLAAPTVAAQLEQAEKQRTAFSVDLERQSAFIEGRAPDFSKFAERPRLQQAGQSLYESQVASRNALHRELVEARAALARFEEGARRGVISEIRASEARQRVASLQARQEELIGEAKRERGKLFEQIAELDSQVKALGERRARAEVRAPIDGVVKEIPDTRLGAVISPGGMVAEIVPTGDTLLVEAMVSPRDIGFVRAGQRAMVKVDSYDYSRFGAVDGTVSRVSPTSDKMKENGAPFYKIEVALAKDHVGDPSRKLLPGMTAEVDITTGRKTILQYLLKPVFVGVDSAFHER